MSLLKFLRLLLIPKKSRFKNRCVLWIPHEIELKDKSMGHRCTLCGRTVLQCREGK